MSSNTIIAWTDHTFNVAWGCTKVSPGCKNCYADTLAERYGHSVWGRRNPRRTFGTRHWREPLEWNTEAARAGVPQRVFCSSMCDIFEDHPTIIGEMRKLWPLIRATPMLHWQLLTKRAEGIATCLPDDWGAGYRNVWLGVSIENADYASRADHLRAIPAAVRFVSYEPALGPLAGALNLDGIGWIIYGGESGPGYRPHDPQWARDMLAACRARGIPFFYKQSAAPRTEMGITLDGRTIREWPGVRHEPQDKALVPRDEMLFEIP